MGRSSEDLMNAHSPSNWKVMIDDVIARAGGA
jgi:hypothetical protein